MPFRNQLSREVDCPVNCVMSDWIDAGACDPKTGRKPQSRTVVISGANGGTACPPASQLSQELDCAVDCVVSQWADGVCNVGQIWRSQTRTVITARLNGGAACPTLSQVVPCPNCSDGIMNGDETGIDCGGACLAASPSQVCPSCKKDNVRNGQETGIDCGGPLCPPCDARCNNLLIGSWLPNGTCSARITGSISQPHATCQAAFPGVTHEQCCQLCSNSAGTDQCSVTNPGRCGGFYYQTGSCYLFFYNVEPVCGGPMSGSFCISRCM